MTILSNNFLSSTNFSLSLITPDGTSLNCALQTANHPSVSAKSGIHSTPRRELPIPGQKLEYEPLKVTLILEESMASYIAIYDWLKQCVEEDDYKAFQDKTIDAKLLVRTQKGNLNKTITYVRCFPTELGGLEFKTTDEESTYLTSDATFEYAYFEIS